MSGAVNGKDLLAKRIEHMNSATQFVFHSLLYRINIAISGFPRSFKKGIFPVAFIAAVIWNESV